MSSYAQVICSFRNFINTQIVSWVHSPLNHHLYRNKTRKQFTTQRSIIRMNISERSRRFPATKIFCNSQLLNALQCSPHRPFQDSKELVDLQLKHDPDAILKAFEKFPSDPTATEYENFMTWAFVLPSENNTSIQKEDIPDDFNDKLPSFVENEASSEEEYLNLLKDIKNRWLKLARKHVSSADMNDIYSRSSLIPLPHTYFVPGGRFRECYYWDTLWVVKGLVASDMMLSAKNAVRNLLHLADTFGFVPNGNRVYYLNRSQPPMLTETVSVVYEAIKQKLEKISWLREATMILDKEYEQFVKDHAIENINSAEKLKFETLCVYNVQSNDPRPESFKEDIETWQQIQQDGDGNEQRDESKIYRDLAAAAESGWDFSSRWFPLADDDLKDIRTSNIIPCCLNSILLKVERTLSHFHQILSENSDDADEEVKESNRKSAIKYEMRAKLRAKMIMDVMWNPRNAFWQDFDMIANEHSQVISAAGIMPAWSGCWEGYWTELDAKRFVHFVKFKSDLLQMGGLSSTSDKSAEQWDFPNCWPPLVDFAVEGLLEVAKKFPESGAEETAKEIAKRFITTVYNGWLKDGEIHEKYDSRYLDGKRGVGGEYAPQTGFGWTNGVVLWTSKVFWKEINSEGWVKSAARESVL